MEDSTLGEYHVILTCRGNNTPLAFGLVEPRRVASAKSTYCKQRRGCAHFKTPWDPATSKFPSTQRKILAREMGSEAQHYTDEL
jgi:hypothetical protein